MNWSTFIAGLVALALAAALRAYLVVRNRQLSRAANAMREFSELSTTLLAADLPDAARRTIVELSQVIGRGTLARRLLRALASGELDTPTRRWEIIDRRQAWADCSREVRIAYTHATFAAILADSYYAGFAGTLLRRSLFFLKNNPADIAEAVDAMETRIIIAGTADIGHAVVERHREHGRLARA